MDGVEEVIADVCDEGVDGCDTVVLIDGVDVIYEVEVDELSESFNYTYIQHDHTMKYST